MWIYRVKFGAAFCDELGLDFCKLSGESDLLYESLVEAYEYLEVHRPELNKRACEAIHEPVLYYQCNNLVFHGDLQSGALAPHYDVALIEMVRLGDQRVRCCTWDDLDEALHERAKKRAEHY